MRHDLKVPFAEKDVAKKIGARWDAARKIWYIVDKEDLAPFSKWSPTLSEESAPAPASQTSATTKTQTTGKVHVGSNYVEYPRVCDCLPWEICDKCQHQAVAHKA